MAMAESESSGNRQPKHTLLALPTEDYVLQSWKVKEGSVVRAGETVAHVCKKGSPFFASSSSVALQPSSTFKRPNRRRKLQPTASTTISAPGKPEVSTSNATPIQPMSSASLQQRLAQRLKERNTSHVPSNHAEMKSPPASDINSMADSGVPILASSDGLLRTSPLSSASHVPHIGYIEECMHPAFFDNLCVVCGNQKSQEYDVASAKMQQLNDSAVDKVTVSGGITMTISNRESREMALQDTHRLRKLRKLSLVLDLDHTLVHATADHRARSFLPPIQDPRAGTNTDPEHQVRTLRLPMMEEFYTQEGILEHTGTFRWMPHYVKLRPHIKEFLEASQPQFELTVYTAGTRQYAEEITIVLCRHLVGAERDAEALEQLRYQVHMAETEYRKHQSLASASVNSKEENEKKRKMFESEFTDRSEQDGRTEQSKEPTSKRRKIVSFGPPQDDVMSKEPQDEVELDSVDRTKHVRSDHMTKNQLDEVKLELEDAETLEQQAWALRQELFGSRVVSRSDVGDLGRDVKSLKRIFPCGGTMAAVVDDREDVWANASDNNDATTRKGEPPDNLLLVRPYHWEPFVGFADVNNAAGIDLSGGGPGQEAFDGEQEKKSDEQLLWTIRILKELHRRFYDQTEGNTRTAPGILNEMRQEVLRDATLVLSGLVPLHKKTVQDHAPRPPIVRYAESLGARVVDEVGPGVTHVVAAKDGTDKALAARKVPGCMLVKASWLVECYWSVSRRDEVPHLIGSAKQPPTSDSLPTSMDTGSEDDDFASSFEDELMRSR